MDRREFIQAAAVAGVAGTAAIAVANPKRPTGVPDGKKPYARCSHVLGDKVIRYEFRGNSDVAVPTRIAFDELKEGDIFTTLESLPNVWQMGDGGIQKDASGPFAVLEPLDDWTEWLRVGLVPLLGDYLATTKQPTGPTE